MYDLSAFRISPESGLLFILNMQNEFCRPEGRRYTPGNESCLVPIKKLLEQARQRDVPIIFVQSVRTQREASVQIWKAEEILHEGSWNSQIVDELLPGEVNEWVIKSYTHDPFFRTNLDEILQRLAPEPTKHYAVVTGVTSNVCHFHAVDGFHQRNYWTIAPVDCTAGPEGLHERSLKRYNGFGSWNVFLSHSDLITFGPPGVESGKVNTFDGPGRVSHDPPGS